LDAFLELNEDALTEEEIAELRGMQVGGTTIYGGGAAATFTLRRIS
jgi:hypothetical protein